MTMTDSRVLLITGASSGIGAATAVAAVERAIERFGRLDAALANAGFGAKRGFLAEGLRQELRQIHENTRIKVTVIAPGAVETPFFDQPPKGALKPEDVAAAALYALQQPDRVDVNEVLLRPVEQAI